MEAMIKVKTAENMHYEKIRSLEETLSKSKEDIEVVRMDLEGVKNELKLSLENIQLTESNKMLHKMGNLMSSFIDLMQKYKQQVSKMQAERDDALSKVEELRKQHYEASSSSMSSQFFLEFSFSEIKEATNEFSRSSVIRKGGFGVVYLATLRHTKVAIKTLNSMSKYPELVPLQFQQEVNILSKLRHPNIVTLIGACQNPLTLVYEFVPGGNLEDCLNCNGDTPPLAWKARICIATEICSALIFIHTFTPHGIVHGDLKPANIFLDARNYTSKLCDFGICCELKQDSSTENDTTRCFCMDLRIGSEDYVAPEVKQHGELTTRSDVYSIGVILLRLLTGKPAREITNILKTDLGFRVKVEDVLDSAAGNWPFSFVQLEQLLHIAIRCTDDINKRNRPRLASEVWRLLEEMKDLCN